MTTKEAAQRLNMTRRHVRNLISEGVIPAKRDGKVWIITENLDITLLKGKHRKKRPKKTNIKGVRAWKWNNRNYALRIGGSTYKEKMEELLQLAHDAAKTDNWTQYNSAQAKLLKDYAVVVEGYHLPPSAELPEGWCFGVNGLLEQVPVEDERTLGSCWDDSFTKVPPKAKAQWERITRLKWEDVYPTE